MEETALGSIVDQRTEIETTFEILKSNQYQLASSTAAQRIAKLNKLHRTLMKYRDEIKDALYQDFRKHPFEVDLTEIYTVTSEIKHARRNIRKWMGKHRVATPLALIGSRSYIHYEPKGVVLIISPWNFPFTLTFGPLVAAISAGNAVVLKPSEQTPHATMVMQKIVEEVFDKNEVVLFPGGIQTSQILLALPFNHLFFTGSSRVGKIVMEAASKHLASVTLELGGKSPTIVDASADINQAARRIACAKYLNNGQICVAPDHVYVHADIREKFVQTVIDHLKKFFGEDPSTASSYARLVNKDHFKRVNGLLENAIQNGASIRVGAEVNLRENYVAPTVLTDTSESSEIMQEEIFGPLLPVQTFTDISDLIELLNCREKPLAMYIFSRNKKNIRQLISGTRSGGTGINHCGIHFFNLHLPYGGSNFSGIGKSHGWFGFESFSNARAIYNQILPSALDILMPPYNRFKQKILDLTIKYL